MRRVHFRGQANILKRLLVHASGFNLGLWMRHRFGVGNPPGAPGAVAPRDRPPGMGGPENAPSGFIRRPAERNAGRSQT